MSEARIIPFHRRPQSREPAEARQGRFMIVSDIETLDDRLDGLPDDIVAFAFRRMVREFRLGRALDDDEAAYKLHKHASTVQRCRRQHGAFLALMDGASGHARHKFLTRKSAKSSNFRRPKPQQNCQTATPEEDPYGKNSPAESSVPQGTQKAPAAAPCLEASTAPAREEDGAKDRGSSAAPSSTRQPVPRPPVRSFFGHFAGCACAACTHQRTARPPEVDPPPADDSRTWSELSDAEKAEHEARMEQLRAKLQPRPIRPRDSLDDAIDRMIAAGLGTPQPPGREGAP
jgi:hypothetical protein